MFNLWQMGFIYFMGPSLTIDSRTPLPLSMDNITMLIALGYILCIIFMAVLPQFVIKTGRLFTFISLLTAISLFLPLSTDILRLMIYTQVFCCCYIIGYETFIMINFFSEENVILHLTAAYSVALFLIAFVQNDFYPISFSVFRIVTVFAIVLLLLFYMRMSGSKDACPRFVKKCDNLVRPKTLTTGTYLIVFAGALMAVSGPSISEAVTHGVFITYLTDAFTSLLIYVCYKKRQIHPFRSISLCIALGAIGFLLTYVSGFIPGLSYLSCALIGCGMVAGQMLPLFGTVLMKIYPSRFYSSIIIGLALVAVLIQSSMVELFRSMPSMLCLSYSVIMVILAFLYMKLEPYFIFTLTEKAHINHVHNETETKPSITNNEMIADTAPEDIKTEETGTIPNPENSTAALLLASLTKREREVLKLISYGYSNADIAKELVISEHTVNDYTKKIYRKLDVHSRHAAANFLIRNQDLMKE